VFDEKVLANVGDHEIVLNYQDLAHKSVPFVRHHAQLRLCGFGVVNFSSMESPGIYSHVTERGRRLARS
jgi:hypothetical protein